MRSHHLAVRLAVLGATVVAVGVVAAPALAFGITATSVGSSQNPSAACGNVTFTATVTGFFPPPLGFVQFFDGGSTLGGLQTLTPDFDAVPLTGLKIVPTNHSSTTITRALAGGSHVITAFYPGGFGDAFSTSPPLIQQVNAATSSTTVSSSVNPSVYGQDVTLGAVVSSSCSGSVVGSVQFHADGTNLGDPRTVDSSGHASFVASSLDVGSHAITATFASSNTDVGRSEGSLAAPQVVNAADTTTGVSSSANPSEFGQAVTFTAATTVDAPGSGTPTGSVQFEDGGANLGGPHALDASGHATIALADLPVGDHTIAAIFTTDSANFNSSTGRSTQTVNRARTTINYDGVLTSDFNDLACLSARLRRTGNSAPLVGLSVTLTMASESCTATTDVNGEAACSITPAEAAGGFTVSAAFAGTGSYLPSGDSGPFTVTKEETTTTYTGPKVIAQGNPVTLSGRLLEDGLVPIAGRTLILTLGTGAGSQSCTGLTDGAGSAQCVIPNISVAQGPEPVNASFAGDAYYLPSADASQSVIVFAFPEHGVFVLGDLTVASGPPLVTFWGAHWSDLNLLGGGAVSPSFKGFADGASSKPPTCGGTWTSKPGNSSSPVETLPAYMGTVVASSASKTGSTFAGTISKIVVVVTAPGYASNPGHAGTGTIIATYC